MCMTNGVLYFSNSFSASKDEAKIARSFWKGHKLMVKLGGDLYSRNEGNRFRILYSRNSFEHTRRRDRQHHYARNILAALHRCNFFANSMTQNQFLQTHTCTKL